MITATEFLKTLIKTQMKDAIINDRFPKKYPVSRNTFAIYNRETKTVFGDRACDGLILIVQGEIKNDQKKCLNVLKYLFTFLDDNDYKQLKLDKEYIKIKNISKNYKLTKEIVAITINKFRKKSNINNTIKSINKNLYVESIISEHEKILNHFTKDIDITLLLIKKLIKNISKTALIVEQITIPKKLNIIEFSLTKNIFPHEIAIMINSLNETKKIEPYLIDYYDITLKTLIDWFIKDFLKKDHKVKTLNEISEKTELKVVDLHDLIGMGWTVGDYVKAVYEIWGEVVENFDEIHKDDIPIWEEIVARHMESRKVLMDQNNKFVGYWNFDLLYEEPFEKAKKGLLGEGDIIKNYIPDSIPGLYNLYFDNILITDKYKKRSFALRKLLYSILETFSEITQDGIFVNEICTWAFTFEGQNLCKNLGMKYLCDHQKDEGQIYIITMKELLTHPMCNDFKDLKEYYI